MATSRATCLDNSSWLLTFSTAVELPTEVSVEVFFQFSRSYWILDIHTGNILFKIPEIDPSLPGRLEALAPQTSTIVKKDGAPIEESLPRYIVKAICNVRDLEDPLTEIQLADFGECGARQAYFRS